MKYHSQKEAGRALYRFRISFATRSRDFSALIWKTDVSARAARSASSGSPDMNMGTITSVSWNIMPAPVKEAL